MHIQNKSDSFSSAYTIFSFLDFFYKRLKPLESPTADEHLTQRQTELKQDGYTFVSLCGVEKNYVRSQDTPIVFRDLIQRENHRKVILAPAV